jgi:signal peptide peptidase-like 3
MLLAFVLCFDHRKNKDNDASPPFNGRKYVWYALAGYAVGLISALAAGILSQSPQPALLYLVCFILYKLWVSLLPLLSI